MREQQHHDQGHGAGKPQKDHKAQPQQSQSWEINHNN